ncbi:hypothetical protein AVEN_143478-1 [Araneus ventricosus]|uniref:Uncharacterized protein n=1 Tax=Araneus ventricosus TaxID=182803 RepID=A0A4Y2J1D5_ARAVE|nr:hypothetical protein AVEN_143478-1 [Araneus ventricosus]
MRAISGRISYFLSLDQIMGTIPQPAPLSPYFHVRRTFGPDAFNVHKAPRHAYTAVLRLNRVSNLESSIHEAEALPPGCRGHRSQSESKPLE